MFIYKLFSLKSPDEIVYVGQTIKTLNQRLSSHKSDTRMDNKKDKVQRKICEWIIKQNYEIGIAEVEEVFGSRELLDEREIYWVKEYGKKYNLLNILPGGRNAKNGALFKERNGHAKRILQYDLSGNFIREWMSGVEAAETLNMKATQIYNCIQLERVKSGGGFMWRYYTKNFEQKIMSIKEINKKNHEKYKTEFGHIILQYDLSNTFVKEWGSMHEIERKTSFKRAGIYFALRHTGIAYGYKWVCKDRDIKQIPPKGPKLNYKRILQYSRDGNFIREWNSLMDAAKYLNISDCNISAALNRNICCRDFQWKFWKEDSPLVIPKYFDRRKVPRKERLRKDINLKQIL